MNLRKLPISLFLSATLLTLPWSGSMAEDEIILKSGEKVTGEILSESASSVEIQVFVTKTIKQRRTYKREEIQTIKKETPDLKEWNAVKAELPVPDLSEVSVYENLIENRIKPFLKKHESSLYALEAKKLLQSVQEEKERIEKGDLKIGGEWVSSEEVDENPMKYRGQVLLIKMQKASEDGKHFEALRIFDELRFNFGASGSLPKAYELAKSSLAKFDKQLKQQIEHQPTLAKSREEGLKNIFNPAEKTRTELAIEDEKKQLALKRETEKEQGVLWLSYDLYDPQQLSDTQKRVETVTAEVEGFDVAAFNRYGKPLADAYKALRDQKPELVQELLAAAKAENAPQAVIDDLGKRASELTRKIEEAKNKPLPTPSEDPDSIEALSPVHKAMSNLNKDKEAAQAEEAAAKKEGEDSETEEKTEEPKAEEATPEASPAEETPATEANSETSSNTATQARPQKKAAQGLPLWNKILIGVAGIMVISVLIAKLTGKGGKADKE